MGWGDEGWGKGGSGHEGLAVAGDVVDERGEGGGDVEMVLGEGRQVGGGEGLEGGDVVWGPMATASASA